MTRRAFLIVLDSVGCGGAPDAAAFGDAGANTLGHIAQACAAGRAEDRPGGGGPLRMPVLNALGLGAAIKLASGLEAPLAGNPPAPTSLWGAATEVSPGKDTPTGHWELAGVPLPWTWTTFPDTQPTFPPHLSAAIAHAAGCGGVLGDCHASGTEIIARLGEAHLISGWPIVYTSADSVVQIAAHEEAFGLTRLLDLCRAIAPMVHDMRVGRVIARPFTGAPGAFTRTPNRRDFALPPPGRTILDLAQEAGHPTIAVGKIGDIFAHRGIDRLLKAPDDAGLWDHLCDLAQDAPDGALVFANLVEFDSLYGHRRDVAGYAAALERADAAAGRFLACLGADDIAIFTADHGNDPTWPGTEHTRERVPLLVAGQGAGKGAGTLGMRAFADVGASLASWLGLPAPASGASFL